MNQIENTNKSSHTSTTEKIDWELLSVTHAVLTHIPNDMRRSTVKIRLDKDDTLFRMGDFPDTMFYLLSGEIRLMRHSRAGADIILQRTRKGFFAEASLDHGSYHCNAVATEPSEFLQFPAQLFRDALALNDSFRNDWIFHLTREVRRLRTQCERLSLNSASERIIHYIESEGSEGTIVLKQTKKSWAAELGLSHEVLYRTLRRMQDQGTLKVKDAQLFLGEVADDQTVLAERNSALCCSA